MDLQPFSLFEDVIGSADVGIGRVQIADGFAVVFVIVPVPEPV